MVDVGAPGRTAACAGRGELSWCCHRPWRRCGRHGINCRSKHHASTGGAGPMRGQTLGMRLVAGARHVLIAVRRDQARWPDGPRMGCMRVQGIVQARWPDEPSVACLPRVTLEMAATLKKAGFGLLSDVVAALPRRRAKLADALRRVLSDSAAEDCLAVAQRMPAMEVRCGVPRQQEAGAGGEEEGVVEEQFKVQVTLTRQGASAPAGRKLAGKGTTKARVYAPRCVGVGFCTVGAGGPAAIASLVHLYPTVLLASGLLSGGVCRLAVDSHAECVCGRWWIWETVMPFRLHADSTLVISNPVGVPGPQLRCLLLVNKAYTV